MRYLLLSTLVCTVGLPTLTARADGPDAPPTTAAPVELAPPALPERLPALDPLAAVAAQTERAMAQRIDVVNANGRVRTTLELGDALYVIDLLPFSMRDPDCVALAQDATGALVPVPLPPSVTYRGRVVDVPDSAVAASVIDGAVHATILMPDARWVVQPMESVAPGLAPDWHVVYREVDVLPTDGTCDVTDEPKPVGDGAGDPLEGGGFAGLGGRTQIAYDADVEYYQLNGSSVNATIRDIETVMNQVGLIYQTQTSTCYQTTGFIVRTAEPDPYSSTNSVTLLGQMEAWWPFVETISRDVAHLFTGKEIDGNVIGRASIGAVCDLFQGYGFSQSQFSTNLTSRTILTAHELGHNWNCCHCDSSGCTGGGTDGDCGVMWSNVNSGSTVFGTRALGSIAAWQLLNNCLGTCYNPVYVDASAGITQNGSSTFPFDRFTEGAAAVPVGGTVNAAGGSYPQSVSLNKPMTIQKWFGSSVVIGD